MYGKAIQDARKKAGYSSAAKFAEAVGMKKDTYTKYEQDASRMPIDKAWIIADFLDISLDELIGRKSPEKSRNSDWTPSEQARAEAYIDGIRSQKSMRNDRVRENSQALGA